MIVNGFSKFVLVKYNCFVYLLVFDKEVIEVVKKEGFICLIVGVRKVGKDFEIKIFILGNVFIVLY